MTSPTELVDRYIAAWNETDAPRRKDLIDRTWTDDALYLDPVMEGVGKSGINVMIEGVQKKFPGWQFQRTSDVDAHHDCLRFTWVLGPDGGAPIAGGVDFGVTCDGLLRKVTGFLNFAPQPAVPEKQQ